MSPQAAILAALAAASVFYVAVWLAELRKKFPRPSTESLVTGFVTNFFDTLGIGSFAPSTAIFRFRRMVPDELIPGTLNAGYTLPVILQAFIFIAAIQVDPITLVLLIAAATAGGWFGAGQVAGLPRQTVRFGVGGALLAAVIAMLMRQLDLFPQGGSGLELRGWRLAAGVAGNFLFGAISTLGIGFYAPCMTMVSLLGMNPAAAFPVMMASDGILQPVASLGFFRSGRFAHLPALGLTLGCFVGVFTAFYIVKSLPLTTIGLAIFRPFT